MALATWLCLALLSTLGVAGLTPRAANPADFFALLRPYKTPGPLGNVSLGLPLFSSAGLAPPTPVTAPLAPWLVRIVVASSFDPVTLGRADYFLCSGALIAYDTVLTLADCATALDVAGLSPAASAALPMAMLSVQAGEGQQTRLVDHWRLLGAWQPGLGAGQQSGSPGLALLRLVAPFTPSLYVAPIPLAASPPIPGLHTVSIVGPAAVPGACPALIRAEERAIPADVARQVLAAWSPSAAANSSNGTANASITGNATNATNATNGTAAGGYTPGPQFYTTDVGCSHSPGAPVVQTLPNGTQVLVGVLPAAGPWAALFWDVPPTAGMPPYCGPAMPALNVVLSVAEVAPALRALATAPRRCASTYGSGVLPRAFDFALSSVRRAAPATASVCVVLPASPANEIHLQLPPGYVLADAPLLGPPDGHAAPTVVVASGPTVQLRWPGPLSPTQPDRSVAFALAVRQLPPVCQPGSVALTFHNCTLQDVLGAGVLTVRACGAVAPLLQRNTGNYQPLAGNTNPSGCSLCDSCQSTETVGSRRAYVCSSADSPAFSRSFAAPGPCSPIQAPPPSQNCSASTYAFTPELGSVKAAMNASADPCADFYAFSCGGFAASGALPGVALYQAELQGNVSAITQAVLADGATIAGQVYQGCANVGNRSYAEVWALLAQWDAEVSGGTTDGLVQAALALHTVGVDATPFLHVSVEDDPFDPTRALFALRNASLTLPRTAYGNDTATALAVNYMTTVLQLVYQDSPSPLSAPDAQQWAASLVNLEATVVAVSDSVWDSVGFQPLPDPATVMSLAQLQGNFSAVTWSTALLGLGLSPARQLQLGDAPAFLTPQPAELNAHLALLADPSLQQALAWYGRFRIIDAFALHLPPAVAAAQRQFRAAVYGPPPGPPGLDPCAAWTLRRLTPAVAPQWARTACGGPCTPGLPALVAGLKGGLKATVQQAYGPWLEAGSMAKALQKIDAINVAVGYGGLPFTGSLGLTACQAAQLQALPGGGYVPRCTAAGGWTPRQCHGGTGFCWCVGPNGTEIGGTRVFGQALQCQDFNGNTTNVSSFNLSLTVLPALWDAEVQRALQVPRDNSHWGALGPWDAAVAAVPTKNAVLVPAAATLRPWYSPSSGPTLNVALLGQRISRAMAELVSFDGLRYDSAGRFQPVWDAYSYENYVYLGRDAFPPCITQVYSSLAAAGLAVPPSLLDMAVVQKDYIGLQAAYATWQQQEAQQPSAPLDQRLTNDQLWWVAAQQLRCAAPADPAAPPTPADPRAAVRGSAALSTAFAAAFACPAGSAMNPAAACKQGL